MNKNKNFKLKNTKKRNKTIWLYGKHAIIAALTNPKRKCHKLLVTTSASRDLEKYSTNVQTNIKKKEIISSKLPIGSIHQGAALEVDPLTQLSLEEWLKGQTSEKSLIIILDQITDPHNIGAILRSATAFSIGAIIVTKYNSPEENATIAKISCGGLEKTPLIQVINLAKAISILKKHDYWCLGLDASAKQTVQQYKSDNKMALILGSEDSGPRPLTQKNCDLMLKIDISSSMESINVSNAAAIAMYELQRKN